MITSKRVLAAGFVAALGLAGLGLGASNAGASADMMGGGLCDGIDLSTLTGGAAAGSAVSGSEAPMATAAAPGTEAAGSAAGGGSGVNVAVLFDVTGRGDKSFNDAAAAGLDKAVADFGVNPTESTPSGEGDRAERLSAAVADGNDLVIAVGFLWGDALTEAAPANPDTHFAIVDSVVDSPNVANLVFAEEQGSFLVGVAAALKTKADHVGFVGGGNDPADPEVPGRLRSGRGLRQPRHHRRGAVRQRGPERRVQRRRTRQGARRGHVRGRRRRRVRRSRRVRLGVLEATSEAGDPGDVWNIGVDSDLYQQVDANLQPYVLTSMLKRVDVATYETIRSEVEGNFTGGTSLFDLSVDGVGYATSGGFVDDIAPVLDGLKALIIDGTIVVPTVPAS